MFAILSITKLAKGISRVSTLRIYRGDLCCPRRVYLVGGHLGALYQPAEFLIIFGAGIGAFVVGNNGRAIVSTVKILPKLLRNTNYNKAMYMDLMALMFRLLSKARQNGMLALERDIENPQQSDIFPNILAL